MTNHEDIKSRTVTSFFINDYTELVFSLSQLGNYLFADIRQFVHTEKYIGPTPKGLSINKHTLVEIVRILKAEGLNIKRANQPTQIATIPYKKNNLIIISLKDSTIDNNPVCVDIREFVRSHRYNGFTKKGFRISINQLDEFIECCETLLSLI
ncbi:MAG: hypothetical protein QXP51_05390 [Candidatus Hadarchaeales archaeon]